jgi:hypothetical protein
MILHQNIRGLKDKTDEIINIIETNPHIYFVSQSFT